MTEFDASKYSLASGCVDKESCPTNDPISLNIKKVQTSETGRIRIYFDGDLDDVVNTLFSTILEDGEQRRRRLDTADQLSAVSVEELRSTVKISSDFDFDEPLVFTWSLVEIGTDYIDI